MATADNYAATIQYGVHQRPCSINLWFQVLTDPASPDRTAQDLAQAIVDATMPQFLANLMSDQAIFDQVRTYLRVPAVGAEAQAAPGYVNIDTVGANAGEALPDSLPLVIEFEQAVYSSKANGRIFLSGIREADTAGNNITAAFQAGAVATFISNWATLLTNFSGPDGGVYRQVTMTSVLAAQPTLSSIYGSPVDVVGTEVNPVLQNQKRRQSRWEAQSRA